MVKNTVRTLLYVLLLAFVWGHSHWSVSLSITLLTIRSEIVDYYVLWKDSNI